MRTHIEGTTKEKYYRDSLTWFPDGIAATVVWEGGDDCLEIKNTNAKKVTGHTKKPQHITVSQSHQN